MDCEVSCDDVDCPDFLDCELRGKRPRSYAVCTLPDICDPLGCPNGTSCATIGRERQALCLADTCENVDCGIDAICEDGTIGTRTNERSNSVRRFLRLLSGRGKRSHSRSNSKSRSRSESTAGARGNQMINIATCFAECMNSTCPDGLVCEERRFELVCRLPRTCEELECPDGQECIVTSCGRGKR